MTEMIEAEPAFAARLLTRLERDVSVEQLVTALRHTAEAGLPVVTTGEGTSLHAAMGLAAILATTPPANGQHLGPVRGEAVDPPVEAFPPRAVEAFELLARPPRNGLLIAVSHEGGTQATIEALEAAARNGAATALISVGTGSPAAAAAGTVVATGEQDRSWCHTVGYLSPLVVAVVLSARLSHTGVDAIALRHLLEVASAANQAGVVANALADAERVLVLGSGIDYVSARELALKIEEGARLAAVAHPLETVRHGHWAAVTDRTAVIVILTDVEGRGEPLRHTSRAVLLAAAALGARAAAIIGVEDDAVPGDLTPAGRLRVPRARGLEGVAAAALATAIPLQLLAERLARARGVNPDLIGRDDPRQAAAARF
ncbi:MAG: SIS domain-containing protein [Chloroflexota bacterium]|nr:SIS domain-containing protein [Chloroflexota bacterium]